MRTPSTDIFGPVEENNDENIEEEEQEEEIGEEQEEEPEEEETSSSEEEEEADDGDELDPWSPLRQKVGEEKKSNEKSNSSWIGENPNTMPKMLLSMSCYL